MEKNTGNGAGFVPATVGDVDFTLMNDGGAVFVLDAGASTCDDAGPDNLDPSGQCTIVFTSGSAGTITGKASVTLSVEGVSLTRDTDPATASICSGPGGSGPAVKRYVDARIAIAPSDTNGITEPPTFTVTVLKNAGDGLGFVPASGVTVTVTLTSAGGAAAVEIIGYLRRHGRRRPVRGDLQLQHGGAR